MVPCWLCNVLSFRIQVLISLIFKRKKSYYCNIPSFISVWLFFFQKFLFVEGDIEFLLSWICARSLKYLFEFLRKFSMSTLFTEFVLTALDMWKIAEQFCNRTKQPKKAFKMQLSLTRKNRGKMSWNTWAMNFFYRMGTVEFKPPMMSVDPQPPPAKKKRRSSTAASAAAQPPPSASQDLCPPPLSGNFNLTKKIFCHLLQVKNSKIPIYIRLIIFIFSPTKFQCMCNTASV